MDHLPHDAPLDMPVQRFRGWRPAAGLERAVPTSPEGMLSRRVLLVLLTGLLATAASAAVKQSLLGDGLDLWDLALLALFFPLFGWIAFGFLTSLIGFVLMMTGAHPGFVPAPRRQQRLSARTAVLVPVHNEDVGAVFGRVARMLHAVADAGEAERFAFFVLSDSGKVEGEAELAAWRVLAPRSTVPDRKSVV